MATDSQGIQIAPCPLDQCSVIGRGSCSEIEMDMAIAMSTKFKDLLDVDEHR